MLYAERALDVSLDQVAEAAGVGIGTVYRRFGTKKNLIHSVFADRVRGFADLAESAEAQHDPWESLVRVFEYTCSQMVQDRGLAALLLVSRSAEFSETQDAFEQASIKVIERAQAAGQLRSDVGVGDFFGLAVMVTAVADVTRPLDATMWRRFADIVLDGVRTGTVQRQPLTSSPMSLDQIRASQQADDARKAR